MQGVRYHAWSTRVALGNTQQIFPLVYWVQNRPKTLKQLDALKQWFSHFGGYQNHVGNLVKTQKSQALFQWASVFFISSLGVSLEPPECENHGPKAKIAAQGSTTHSHAIIQHLKNALTEHP